MIGERGKRKRLSWPGVLLLAMICGLAGFAWAQYRWQGYPVLAGAMSAARAVGTCVRLKILPHRSAHHIAAANAYEGGVLVNAPEATPGATLVTAFVDGEYTPMLLAEDGRILHRWWIPWSTAGALTDGGWCKLTRKHLFVHGAHLYPNGDLLLSIEFKGLLKLSANSELLWELNETTHHTVAVAADNTIWTLGRQTRLEGPLAEQFDRGYVLEDELIQLDPDGNVINRLSLLNLLLEQGYAGLLLGSRADSGFANSDPLHANDIKVLTRSQARHVPGARRGDLLVSLRAVSTLVVVRPETQEVVWLKSGPFLRQHDPEIDADGHLWVYDNRTEWPQKNLGAEYLSSGQGFGASRLLQLSMFTQQPLWSYSGNAEHPFFSSIMGRLQVLPSGNLLVVEPESGSVFELEVPSGHRVWHYQNLIERGWVGRISDAQRYPYESLPFLKPGA